MSTKENVLVEQQDSILKVHINRPEKKNALTEAMYLTLIQALQQAEATDDIRVVLLSGHENAFSAGNDLEDFLNQEVRQEPVALALLRQLVSMNKPVVAAVNTMAVGIGVTMLLHCDLVYAGENTRFRLPFVNLGLVPEAASSLLLPAMIGRQRASELLLLGDYFDSNKAKEYGIVNEVVASDQVYKLALDKARQLAEKPQLALRLTKQLINKALRDEIEDRIGEEGMWFARQLASPEAQKIIGRFMEKKS
ncbi:hypothetical protein ACH42_00690 [Endozoicomonas sp. (ex Bugula neritina AB1)]|nr:hypothetical protein ACH42_00690 [Endozoicomonas sp. (ex Bugula neritina AB1)]